MLALKKLTPVRLIKNKFFDEVFLAEKNGADENMLKEMLGRGRAKKGMFEGDMNEGELEIGQAASLIKEIKSAKEIVDEIWNEFLEAKKELLQ